jgi:hypothetical protein
MWGALCPGGLEKTPSELPRPKDHRPQAVVLRPLSVVRRLPTGIFHIELSAINLWVGDQQHSEGLPLTRWVDEALVRSPKILFSPQKFFPLAPQASLQAGSLDRHRSPQ